MKEAYEVELNQLTASFLIEPFDLVLGVEKGATMVVDSSETSGGSTDIEWQVIYARVLVADRWWFLPTSMYDEIDREHGDQIGDKLWSLTQRV